MIEESSNSSPDFLELIKQLPRVAGEPSTRAGFRHRPEDFFVQELINFEFDGQGDHLCVLVEKTGLNTHEVIDRLIAVLNVGAVDIGYFGLKDKQAVTQQWFSIHLPGKTGAEFELELGEGVTVLEQTRHSRKLRIGTHKGNRFIITLRDLEGDLDHFAARLAQVYQHGFPNYFAEQRFGFGAQNIVKAQTMFRTNQKQSKQASNARGSGRRASRGPSRRQPSRRQRGLYLSAVRGFLFNIVLANRVREESWLIPLEDEKLILAGTQSFFDINTETDSKDVLHERLAQHDIHTSGTLWGRGDDITPSERLCLQPFAELTAGLELAGLTAARRALRASVTEASLEWRNSRNAVLRFDLPSGSYATSLLREVCFPETLSKS